MMILSPDQRSEKYKYYRLILKPSLNKMKIQIKEERK
jgi:hypothetical protein